MKPIKIIRPIAIMYYTDARGGLPVAHGSCNLAIKYNDKQIKDGSWKRAAATQVFALERFRRAEVVDRRTGKFLGIITRTVTGKIDFDDKCVGKDAVNYHWREKMLAKARRK